MQKKNYIIIVLVILIVIVISADLMLLHKNSTKLSKQVEEKIKYKLCLKDEDIEHIEDEVHIDGMVLKDAHVFDYHRNSKIKINYDEANNIYNIVENETRTFKDRSYYEAHKEFYDSNKTTYTVLDDENMILLLPTEYKEDPDEINDFINVLNEDEWVCQ